MAHRRRRIGVGGVKKQAQLREKFEAVGNDMKDQQLSHVQEQMGTFKTNLEEFARKHRATINKDPEFRRQFQMMTTSIGVDPLASHKGFWADLLGVGDFYYELGIQVIDICLATRNENGGLISVEELTSRIEKLRGSNAVKVSLDDIQRAIKKVSMLGSGFQVIEVGKRKMVLSVPCELNPDHASLMELAQESGHVSEELIASKLKWDESRIERAMDALLKEGMVWVDTQADETEYWFPSLFLSNNTELR
eukprot:TRINITY_DN776156_c0_g1_i1.p1 TRINITY_DN776156_c0_g1~~TRINITY_DN776156_c0_g1_i1.p1  ORF type:complete len:250 (-),score=56.70 TRINITY_DN776156_c0_g1_i1:138-887(-)